jgi:hypothetical protein
VNGKLHQALERTNPVLFSTFAGLAGFAAYFSMYAFRKPFSVAIFGSVPGWHFALDYKIALVLAQVLGYAASKMIGVKVIAEVTPNKRAAAILVLIFMSWLALLLFAVVPAPWNVFAMFLNGLPLGLIWVGVIIVVRDNVKALLVIHGVVFAGLLLLGLSTLAFQTGLLSPLAWMILSGAGLYMAYVPFNAMLFDRLIAASGTVGTAGFLIYVADTFGYLGSCALLLWRNFGLVQLDWLQVFTASAYGASIIGMILIGLSAIYFLRKTAPVRPFGIEPAHHPARP